MEEFENEKSQSESDFGISDMANDITKFEQKSKQKPSFKPTDPASKPSLPVQTISKPKQALQPVPAAEIEEDSEEAERAKLKNQILTDQLYKKSEELKQVKQIVKVIGTTENADIKEKKLIELAKNNRNLKLKVETAKSSYFFNNFSKK